ncbi:MAG: LAGLIDADG family homing endonuclease [Candidatus Woesearchaeota archaeon]
MKNLSYKPIHKIKVEDEVVSKDNKGNLVFSKVKKTFKRTVNNLVKLKTNKFDLICTPEHEFYYHPCYSHWVQARILKNKMLHWFGYGFEENKEFKTGWLAGIADGDGCFFRDKLNRFSFRLKIKDEEIIDTFKKWSNEEGFDLRKVDYNKKRGFFTVILTKNKETEKFRRFLEKNRNIDFCRGYLAGIYDAEGSGPNKVKQAVIYNSNKTIVEFISEALKDLEVSFKIYLDKRNDENHKENNYHIKINNVPEFFIKCRPVLERKRKNLLKMTLKSVKSRLKILDVIKINKKIEVYNIETENHNYIVNGLLVHNCDHQDSISARDSGWLQFYVESSQEAFDTTIQAYKIAEQINLPVMVCVDGFTLSHMYEPVDILEQNKVNSFLPKYKPKFKLDTNKPITIGPVAYPNTFMQFKKQQQDAMLDSIKLIKKVNSEFKNKFKRSYGDGLIETYNLKNKKAIIAMGSVCGTIREFCDKNKIGLIKIRCFRPFPKQELINACKNLNELIVIDRNISIGNEGALATEVKSILKNKKIKSYIAGLGGKDITINDLEKTLKNKEGWIL